MAKVKEVLAAWSAAENGALFALTNTETESNRGRSFFLEPYVVGPDMRIEAVLRIFTAKEDADRYLSVVRGCNMADAPVEVETVNLENLFEALDSTAAAAFKEYGTSVRLVLSEMAEDQWPKDIDTVWSKHIAKH